MMSLDVTTVAIECAAAPECSFVFEHRSFGPDAEVSLPEPYQDLDECPQCGDDIVTVDGTIPEISQ